MKPSTQILHVWGDLACFTRPEMKIERFSYVAPTPSAVRGIFDAIYRKKTFRWQVTKIEILKPPRYISLRRNEVKDKVSAASVGKWMSGKEEPAPLFADVDKKTAGTDQKGRTQRQTMALKDVAYRMHARILPWSGYESDIAGMEAQFRRRARAGQCAYQPCLGCREFPAYFSLIEPDDELAPPAPVDMEVGLMLYDVFDLSRPGTWDDKPSISLFRATIAGGVMPVPDYFSSDVLKHIKEVGDA